MWCCVAALRKPRIQISLSIWNTLQDFSFLKWASAPEVLSITCQMDGYLTHQRGTKSKKTADLPSSCEQFTMKVSGRSWTVRRLSFQDRFLDPLTLVAKTQRRSMWQMSSWYFLWQSCWLPESCWTVLLETRAKLLLTTLHSLTTRQSLLTGTPTVLL